MKPALVVACVASLWGLACKEIPQAPHEVVPTAPTFTKIRIDSQFNADYGNAIVYPSLVLSGTTTFGLTYGLSEAGRYRFAGCPIGCEERHNWVVGDPDTTAGFTGFYSASAATDESMQTAYQLWTRGARPVLKYASCIAQCQRPSSWSTTAVDTNSVTGFFVSLGARFGTTHIAYVTAEQLGIGDTTGGLRYAACSTGCTTMHAWTRTAVDIDAYGETQIAVDPAGVVHIVYRRLGDDNLRYARCAAACTTTANWQLSAITAGVYPSLAVDESANLALAYADSAVGPLRVATCAAGCATGVWTEGVVATPEGWTNDVALTISPSGKLYLTYGTITSMGLDGYGMVRLGGCASRCSLAANWSFITVDSTKSYQPWVVSVALDSTGHAGIGHADSYAMYFTLVKELP